MVHYGICCVCVYDVVRFRCSDFYDQNGKRGAPECAVWSTPILYVAYLLIFLLAKLGSAHTHNTSPYCYCWLWMLKYDKQQM